MAVTNSEYETLASEDPTRSQTKRSNWQRRFHSRWRTVRGDIRSLIEGDRHYRPRSDLDRDADSAQIADFREWLEEELEEEIVEPIAHRGIRNGRHYTAPFVQALYVHGIDRADTELRRAGWDFDGPDPEAPLQFDHHEEALAGLFVETYQDIEDAARGAEQEATRAYRDSVHEDGSISETVDAVNDRVDKTGRYRTDLVAAALGVVTVNRAALNRYEEAGVEEVGAHIEVDIDVEEIDEPDDPDDPDDPDEYDFRTAEDHRVCSTCRTYAAGGPYRIEDIRSGEAPMPVRDTHINCRCFLAPAN
jgi:hypothetical protein